MFDILEEMKKFKQGFSYIAPPEEGMTAEESIRYMRRLIKQGEQNEDVS